MDIDIDPSLQKCVTSFEVSCGLLVAFRVVMRHFYGEEPGE
jgi:hypothetical protein